MNSTEENCSSDERAVSEKTEPDKSLEELMPPPVEEITDDDSTVSYTSSVKCLTRDSMSLSPGKRESISPIKSIKNDSSSIMASDSPITINEDLPLVPKSSTILTDSVDSDSGKCGLNSSDVVLIEEYEKSTDSLKIPDGDTSSKRVLEISANSDVHIVESPETNNTDSKSFNDSVQIITPDIGISELPKPLPDAFTKIVSEDSGKFISPVCADSKSSDRLNFDTQPAYSTPNELEIPKTGMEGSSSRTRDSTDSLTSSLFPPIYKKLGFFVEFTAAIHMNKELWTGEMTNIAFDMLTIESVPPRLSDTSGNLGDVSKTVSPAFSSSLTQFPLKPRISMASSSSSSSGLSSASTLARKLQDSKCLNPNKKDEVKVTDEYTQGLCQKWINSTDMCNKFLAFIDRNILNADSIIKDDSLKSKPPIEEPKEMKKPLAKIEEVTTPVSTNKVRQTRGKRQAKVKFTADSESDVPKKRQRRAESAEVKKPPHSTKYSEGDSVFAKWGDRKFYAATLGEMNTEGKWQVNFFDGDKKTLLEEFLIKAEDYSTMVGSNVYASQGDDNFTPGIITGFDIKDGVLQYIVVRDKGDISVPCQFIYITESQARQIRGKTSVTMRTPPKTNDNVIMSPGTKRSTRSKTRQLLDSPKPSVSGTQQAQSQLSDSDDDDHDDNNELNLEDVVGVEPESHGIYENGIKLKGKTLAGKMRFAKANKANDTDATVLGPIPDEGSKYFKNLHVLLTCTRPQSPKLPIADAGSSGNATSSESENYSFSAIPFIKDRLKLQLQMGGASVYNNFDDIPQKLWKSTYLISNRPNISARYVQCLAAGIKVLCHEWVIRCCIEKKKVPLQELPLGWSLERERYFNMHDRKSTNALKKLSLLIADTGDKSFMKFWTKICKLADINVAKLTRDSNLEQVTAIISESGFKDDHLERAMSHTIPVVTTAWLIQSLLHGEPRNFDGHKSYYTEYVDSD